MVVHFHTNQNQILAYNSKNNKLQQRSTSMKMMMITIVVALLGAFAIACSYHEESNSTSSSGASYASQTAGGKSSEWVSLNSRIAQNRIDTYALTISIIEGYMDTEPMLELLSTSRRGFAMICASSNQCGNLDGIRAFDDAWRCNQREEVALRNCLYRALKIRQ